MNGVYECIANHDKGYRENRSTKYTPSDQEARSMIVTVPPHRKGALVREGAASKEGVTAGRLVRQRNEFIRTDERLESLHAVIGGQRFLRVCWCVWFALASKVICVCE